MCGSSRVREQPCALSAAWICNSLWGAWVSGRSRVSERGAAGADHHSSTLHDTSLTGLHLLSLPPLVVEEPHELVLVVPPAEASPRVRGIPADEVAQRQADELQHARLGRAGQAVGEAVVGVDLDRFVKALDVRVDVVVLSSACSDFTKSVTVDRPHWPFAPGINSTSRKWSLANV